MRDDQRELTRIASKKAIDAIALVEASLSDLQPFAAERFYTPK